MPSSLAPDRLELNTANDVLGGTFTSRINMNLREDKHWSYGARSSLPETRGQRPWLLSAPVQTDKTVESIARDPPRAGRVRRRRRPATARGNRQDPQPRRACAVRASYETNAAVSGAIGDMVRVRPARRLRAHAAARGSRRRPTPACARQRAQAFRPDALTWVIVGDLAKIEAPIRELGLGEVQVLDADGKPVR